MVPKTVGTRKSAARQALERRAAKARRTLLQRSPAKATPLADSPRVKAGRVAVTKTDLADEMITSWRRELPEIAGLTLEVCKRIARLNTMIDEVLGVELAKLELTRAEYAVLATLRRMGQPYRLRPSELTASLRLSSGGISNVIRRIVDAGYVERSGDPTDGRSSWVQLTAHGVALAEAAVTQAIAAQEAFLDAVPVGKVSALSDLLREVLLSLGDESNGRLRSA